MGYTYTKKEMAHLNSMNKKFDALMKEYKKGKSFRGYYILLLHGSKFPEWGVTKERRFWEKEKTIAWRFKSLKAAKNFIMIMKNTEKLELRND
jgi:hypothetical protein